MSVCLSVTTLAATSFVLTLRVYDIQVINCYMKLLMKEAVQKTGSVFIASTFFYTKLQRSGVQGMKRWLNNVRV